MILFICFIYILITTISAQDVLNNRTAVCISGQLRAGNVSWFSGKLRNNGALKMFGDADPPTTIATQLEWLIKILADHGGVDVFMYQTAHPEAKSSNWNGETHTFETVAGDDTVCRPYSSHPIFSQNSTNKFFCLVEPEVELMTPFLLKLPAWRYYTYGQSPILREQLLQQFYGMYRCNLASKQYALSHNITYTYKVRLRPDTAVVKMFPRLSELKFRSETGGCKKTIYYANKYIHKNGAEDWFNVGLAEDMDHLLDRYIDFTSTPFGTNELAKGNHYDAEDYVVGLMRDRYNICMTWESTIWMVVIRWEHWGLNSWPQPPNPYPWTQLYSDTRNLSFTR